jgi:hypothetical protein
MGRRSVVAAVLFLAVVIFAVGGKSRAADSDAGTIGGSASISGTGCVTGTTAVQKGNGSGGCTAASAGTDYAPPTSGTAILKGNGTGSFANAVSGTDYAPKTTGLSLLKGNNAGGFANAVAGTDYAPPTSGTAILKGNGAGGFANAVSGADYPPLPPSTTAILKGNGSGGFSIATSGTDYAPSTSGFGTAILKANGTGGFSSAFAGTDYQAPISGQPITPSSVSSSSANPATSAFVNDVNNHTSVAASDVANDGNDILEIGTDASNLVHIGGGAASGISFDNDATLNQGQFTSGNYLDAPAVNTSFMGGTENCSQKWHEYTLAANSTITLSCPPLVGNPQQTLDYLLVQPASGSTFTYTFAAGSGAVLLGDNPTACNVNSCIDQVEVTWVPALNDYLIRLVKANIGALATCPAGQTCYYVSSSGGSDSNNGTSTGTAFASISKAEAVIKATPLNPGDQVLFKGGDTWTGDASLNPELALGSSATGAVVGSAAKPIIFSTYGTGYATFDANNTNARCISAINPANSVKYVTVSNFKCLHAWAQAIYFNTSSTSSTQMPGITISNNFTQNTGPGCADKTGACVGYAGFPDWTGSSHSYPANQLLWPQTNNSGNYIFYNRAACTSSSGATQPTWPQTLGNTVTDNTCVWTNVGNRHDDWVDWAASSAYGTGGAWKTFIEPTVGNTGVFGAHYVFQETVASCTSGGTEPGTWNQTVGGTTSDGTCTWKNTGVAGHYKNQLGIEDDATNGHNQDGVKILNNTVKWGGGWDLVEVHLDTGGPIVQGNIVGPGGNHGFIDSHGGGSAGSTCGPNGTATCAYQVLSNVVQSGFAENLMACQNAGPSCSSVNTPGIYEEGLQSSSTATIIAQLNTVYDGGLGMQVVPSALDGDCAGGTGTCPVSAKVYNNTFYIPPSATASTGFSTSGGDGNRSGSSIDLRNNILDGGSSQSVFVNTGFTTHIEDYNDIGGAQGSPGFSFNGSSTRGAHDLFCASSCAGGSADPLYANAGIANFAIPSTSPCFQKGLAGLTSGMTNIGAF